MQLIEGVSQLIAQARRWDYKIFLITNQTVISRGLLTWAEAMDLNQFILNKMGEENPDAYFDETFLCPHHPQATLPEYKQDCDCRKPKAGMILAAKKKYSLNLQGSFVIGDRVSDIIAGNLAGCQSILFQSGQHLSKLIETTLQNYENLSEPQFIVKNLFEI